ncbi:myosin-10 [Cinnamomum micranthum f. kanehirae]|uniref:Myosin-10 n=1 Tax=Cinnamomum micranthum f. kanehirae TaxID=337451 RepID=A0A443Q1Y1_9MAGN|nr:myosin-10 [Cinnamomum micranthum f. kanehirae]
MASSAEDDADAVLSDVEEAEDPVPITLQTPSSDELSSDPLRRLLSDLDRERQARQAAESEKAELQSHFNRLKVYVHEAIKMRDENGRLRDDAVRERDETMRFSERLSGELVEARRAKDEILKQRDEIARQLEEAIKVKDSSRSEIESAAQMLVTGIEKISGKVSSFKNFSSGGLPRSQKYSGLPAIAYGVIKRTNEIVEELLKQVDMASKSRNDAREQMEHRNYEIAIEVSQLEATISGLKEQLEKKSLEAENLEKVVGDKDTKISEMDRDISELGRVGKEFDEKLRDLELKMDSYRPLVIDQLNHMSKAQEQLYEIMKMVDVNVSDDQMDLSDSVFLSNEMDENLHASLEGMKSIHELLKIAVAKVRVEMEERSHEVKDLNETVARLVTEKQHIGSLLRSALSKKMASDPSSKTNDVLQVAENGLRDAGLDVRFSNVLGNVETVETVATHGNQAAVENEQDEVYTLAGALEKIVRDSQLEIIDLQHSVEALRYLIHC